MINCVSKCIITKEKNTWRVGEFYANRDMLTLDDMPRR